MEKGTKRIQNSEHQARTVTIFREAHAKEETLADSNTNAVHATAWDTAQTSAEGKEEKAANHRKAARQEKEERARGVSNPPNRDSPAPQWKGTLRYKPTATVRQ